MPGTTRYSATFDRTYEEDDRVAPEPVTTRRSRSQSWQANCGTDGRPYTPLAGMRPSQRSSSTDNGPSQAAANIPTRTVANTAVKAHNNPFQFVKVGTCPLYKKAEEQLKKVKEVKKPEVLKEEEEEWQSNLDSWKSRRRKMSEDVFRRQEEIRQLEIDEQIAQANQKKTKTFSEMVESRAHRGRALSLCLISSPLELQNWEFENKSILKSHFSGGSEGNSTVNSEDEGVNLKSIISNSERADDQDTDHKVNGDAHIMNNGSVTDSIRNGNNKFSAIDSNNLSVHKEGTYIDSGLESISSSHRAGDTPDSGSDFSQDSGSSMDCESPRISGVNLLEDYNGKSMPMIDGDNLLKEKLDAADKLCGLSTASVCGSIVGQINGAPVSENAELKCSSKISGSKAYSGKTTKENTKTSAEVHKSSSQVSNKKIENSASIPGILPQQHEKSIESENEMYVDDFDELSKLSMPSGQQPGVGSSQVQITSITQKTNSADGKETVEKNQSQDCLNIVFESQSFSKKSSDACNSVIQTSPNTEQSELLSLKNDIPPVEKVAEEMEKLILEQLEEEERAKEMATEMQVKSTLGPAEHLIAPPRQVEPPKEKPPPPPTSSTETPKQSGSLKRVNSTKRIKKEIHKRRSDFLGIENSEDNVACGESAIPPPPALEEILKAEMELDRESRRKLESAADQRLTLEEKEIIKKEREIIETLESEERQKHLTNNCEDVADKQSENDRIQLLKEERKKMEEERLLSEEQRLRLIEEKQLREREEYIKKQEEAIRKERERLRQEQEALQREREEHRRKLMLEQEELVKNQQKSHAPDAPATRLGTLPPLVKPSLTSQLTTPLTASSNARENATFTSRSHHGAQNGVVGSIGPVEPICHPANRQTRVASSRGKTAQNEAWGQQKVPSVRKQNQDSLTESRYNQNHWLIQEAEMRRITELKERQRASQIPYPQTHLAEDDVCSTSPRVPVLSPNPSQHMNYSAAEKHWNYAQPNTAIKNYPPAPVKSDKPLPVYPRESVSHPPSKPSRVVPMERQEQMLSVSGRKRCSHCNEELGRGAAMIIESLQLYYHIHCFQCCVCQAQLGNGSCGTDVRVRNNKLHCHNCYSNDEAGLKFSQV